MVYEFPPEAVLRLNGYVSRGVKAAEIDENGHLLLTLTDGTVADLGSAVGPQGKKGDKGDTGAKGDTGEKGDKGDKGEKGDTGNTGATGAQGIQGVQGEPGYSPTVQISKTGKVTTVTITDENGDHVFKINDGQDGTGSGDMHTSTYDPQGKAQDIFAYADEQAGAAMDAATAAASAASSAQSAASSAQSAASSAASAAAQAQDTADTKLAKSGNGSNVTAAFTKASSRTNIATGEKLSVLFGKIAKWLADLGSLAFKSTVAKSDLASDVQTSLGKADTAMQSYKETDPTVPSWAKAEKKPTYTASEVGAVPTSRKVNGKALSADITLGAVYTATLTAAGWVTSGAWKTQTVSVTGLKASYNAAPFVDVALSGTDAAADAELATAWLGISASAIANTAANSLTVKFPATVDTPTVNIPIRITTYD